MAQIKDKMIESVHAEKIVGDDGSKFRAVVDVSINGTTLVVHYSDKTTKELPLDILVAKPE